MSLRDREAAPTTRTSIRKAEPADVPAIQSVARASWRFDYRFISADRLEAGVRGWYAPSTLERELANPDALLLVADVGGAVVGFAHARADPRHREGDLLRLYVHPKYRDRGIGRALFAETTTALSGMGLDRLRATALAANRQGNDFYRHLGFSQSGSEWTDVGGEWVLEHAYVRDLAPPRDERAPPRDERRPIEDVR